MMTITNVLAFIFIMSVVLPLVLCYGLITLLPFWFVGAFFVEMVKQKIMSYKNSKKAPSDSSQSSNVIDLNEVRKMAKIKETHDVA